MKIKIAYLDDYIIVVNKPSGIPSHSLRERRGRKEGEERTVGSFLLEKYPGLDKVGNNPLEAGLVNRLDNDTSGLLVAARDRKTWLFLRGQFKQKKVKKEYIALVVGELKGAGEIECYVAHSKKSKKKMVVVNRNEVESYKAKLAKCEYEVIRSFKGYTLVKITTSSGLRHQVRIQLAWFGYPLAGDVLYQKKKHREKDKIKINGHFLHSSKMLFVHPGTKKQMCFESSLSDELEEILNEL